MYYQVEPLFPGLTRIWDVAHTAIYLAEGAERAVLIDTGVGVGDLKSVVESLTDKPITVLLTHGHVDHALGALPFEDVRISTLDTGIYASHSSLEGRKGYVAGSAAQGGDPAWLAGLTEADYLPPQDFSQFAPLAGGDRFDLGGLTVEVIAAPGHTPGTMVLLLPEPRVLILGDACNAFTYLFEKACPTVAEYREMLLGLRAETAGKFDRVLFSHGTGEGAADMIDRVIAVCDDILCGNVDNVPFRGFDGEMAAIAKAMDFQKFCRMDGGEGNVVYDPEKIR